MPWGEFTSLTIDATGKLLVTGPYDPGITGGQEILGDVVIGFLIIQDDNERNPKVIVDGVAILDTYANAPVNGKYTWTGIVDADKVRGAGHGLGLRPGQETRAIGTAVQVTDYQPDDPKVPPGVSTFTWCVGVPVTEEDVGSES